MKSTVLQTGRPVTAVLKALLFFASFLAVLGVNQSLTAGERSGFSVHSIRGCYIEALSGAVLPDSSNPILQLPIASLIRFCADGKGTASVSATHNIAGSCILEQSGEAEYSVERNGTGTVTATLTNLSDSSDCTVLFPQTFPQTANEATIFVLRFGIQRLGGCLQTIGAGLTLPSGPIGYVAQGEACPQR
jgi:hypothetical protein